MQIEFAPQARAEYRDIEPDELFEGVRDFLTGLARRYCACPPSPSYLHAKMHFTGSD